MAAASFEELIKQWSVLVKGTLKLFSLEVELAQQSILPLGGIFILLWSFILILGAVITCFLGYVIYRVSNEPLLSFLGVALLNLAAIGLLYCKLKQYYHNLLFPRTRDIIFNQGLGAINDRKRSEVKNSSITPPAQND